MIRGTWSFSEPLMSVNIPALIVKVCENKGIHRDVLLNNTGINPESLCDPLFRLSYSQLISFCNNYVKSYPSADIGYDLGMAININQFGILGYAIMSCQNFFQALQLWEKYHTLVEPTFIFDIIESKDTITIKLSSYISNPKIYNMLCDAIIMTFIRMIKFLTNNSNINPEKISLNYQKPTDTTKFIEYCKCPMLYDQSRTSITYKRIFFDQPLIFSNDITRSMAESQCSELLIKFGGRESLATKVRKIILMNPGVFPSIDQVSDQLAISTRTLCRSLRRVGTSYQKILDGIRKEISVEHLCNSDLPVEEIAVLTGYSDPSNFRKAFRRWTGRTPSSYRYKSNISYG